MKPQCVICSDLFDSNSEVSATPCGHVFHQLCLLKWLSQSSVSTCPQCRYKVSEKNIIMKLYFDYSGDDSNQPDPASLLNIVSELKIKLCTSHKDKKNLESIIASLKEEIQELEVKKSSALATVEHKQIALTAQKLQLEYLEEKLSNAEAAQKEVVKLNKKLVELQNIEKLLNGRPDEIQEILQNCGENSHATRTLATYCSLLKKELQSTSESKKSIQHDKQRLQDEASVFRQKLRDKSQKIAELHTKLNNVQADLQLAQEEKLSLQKKILDLEKLIKSPSSRPTSSSLSRFLLESPAPAVLTPDNKRPKLSDPTQDGKENLRNDTEEKMSHSSSSTSDPAEEIDQVLQVPKFRLLAPKTIISKPPHEVPDFSVRHNTFRCVGRSEGNPIGSGYSKGLSYDGFGGHSSADEFPRPGNRQRDSNIKRKNKPQMKQRTLESFISID